MTLGSGPLYDKLHELFDADYPPSRLHELLASLPRRLGLAERRRYQLIMTTNYDDALERAFRAAGEAFDLVWYVAETEDRGKFLHLPPDGEPRSGDQPGLPVRGQVQELARFSVSATYQTRSKASPAARKARSRASS